jgi:non-ribosomal peptide synthetase component F
VACVIYAPESATAPQGVEITHDALDNALHALRERLSWQDEDEVLLAVTTPSLGFAGLELFLPLTTGARLELATEVQADNADALADLAASAGVTTMHATPDAWRMLVDGGWPGDPALRMVCAGKPLPADLRSQLQGRGRVFWAVYGPMEANCSTAARLSGAETVPLLGRPLANTTCHVVGPDDRPVPIGVDGELLIGGRTLARGYRNRPDLTARRFVTVPRVAPGRLYRTGDMARWRPDGELEFSRRRDVPTES